MCHWMKGMQMRSAVSLIISSGSLLQIFAEFSLYYFFSVYHNFPELLQIRPVPLKMNLWLCEAGFYRPYALPVTQPMVSSH